MFGGATEERDAVEAAGLGHTEPLFGAGVRPVTARVGAAPGSRLHAPAARLVTVAARQQVTSTAVDNYTQVSTHSKKLMLRIKIFMWNNVFWRNSGSVSCCRNTTPCIVVDILTTKFLCYCMYYQRRSL